MTRGPQFLRKALIVGMASAFGFCAGVSLFAQARAPRTIRPVITEIAVKAPLDLNKASAYDLEELPGIGLAEAKKIINGRPYRTKADLLSRKILPAATYKQIAPMVMTNVHQVKKPNC